MAHMKIAYFGPFVLSHVEYTLCLKKMFPPFNILHCWKAYEICYKTQTTIPISP